MAHGIADLDKLRLHKSFHFCAAAAQVCIVISALRLILDNLSVSFMQNSDRKTVFRTAPERRLGKRKVPVFGFAVENT